MSDVDSFVRFCESEFGTAVLDREAAYVKRHLSTDDRTLDVGCGIGSLEERFPDREMIGVDRSETMIRTARNRVSAPFVLGDATALPIATASVDAIVFVSTLEFIPDIGAVLAEATRVLDSDGTLVALVLNTRSEYVRSNLQREGSYFQRMVHRDSAAVADTILEYVEGKQEFFLGISDERVFESTDPSKAAISAVVGTPIA
ncbi:class I SAM-dependent methyltransferase [Halobellus limi]|uniref:Methyltransferase domain-containing protein n=1 Tax=Halobellus limi TaxID=699433 RepID=A0A1H6AMI9_9EURY|nr:class I SAM-dependent methyltransferase [Halobellus limi]QCC47654.1 methyltransferase domain-containing protein [Halobellus limi]SEG49622.1 Methyltransferase domain-containing protein [Halobellus limi]